MITAEFPVTAQEMRYEIIDNEPWFHAADVCKILGLANTAQTLLSIEPENKNRLNLNSVPGSDPWFIDEEALYTIALGCRDARKPDTVAYKFRKWVIEVIKTIRKTGSYGTTPEQQQKTDEAFDLLSLDRKMRSQQLHYLDLMSKAVNTKDHERLGIALTAVNNVFKSTPSEPVSKTPVLTEQEAIAKLQTKLIKSLTQYPGQTARELRKRFIVAKGITTLQMFQKALQNLIETKKVTEEKVGRRISLFVAL